MFRVKAGKTLTDLRIISCDDEESDECAPAGGYLQW
jgi:hypothetical protein